MLKSEEKTFKGVKAVINNEHTATTLATEINSEVLLILTNIDRAFFNYGRPNQKEIEKSYWRNYGAYNFSEIGYLV